MTGKKPKALVTRKPKKAGASAATKKRPSVSDAKDTSTATKKRKVPKLAVATTKKIGTPTKVTPNAEDAATKEKNRKKVQSMSSNNPASAVCVGDEDNKSLSVLLAAVDKKSSETTKACKTDDVSDTETEDSFPMYNQS